MNFLDGWFAAVPLFTSADGGAGSQATKRCRNVRTQGAGVIEGQHPVEGGEGEKIRLGDREGEEGCGAGVDQCSEHAGGGGFSAGWRAFENQDGVRALRAESG